MLKNLLFALAIIGLAAAGTISFNGIPNPYAVTLAKDKAYAFPLDVAEVGATGTTVWTVTYNSTGLPVGTGLYVNNWLTAKANLNVTVGGVDKNWDSPLPAAMIKGFYSFSPAAAGIKSVLKDNLMIKSPPTAGMVKIVVVVKDGLYSKAQVVDVTVVDKLGSASTAIIATWLLIAMATIASIFALF